VLGRQPEGIVPEVSSEREEKRRKREGVPFGDGLTRDEPPASSEPTQADVVSTPGR